MRDIMKFDFHERKQLHFLRKLSKLHKKENTIFHVTITFPLKQGQTRTNSGPIWVPLLIITTLKMGHNSELR